MGLLRRVGELNLGRRARSPDDGSCLHAGRQCAAGAQRCRGPGRRRESRACHGHVHVPYAPGELTAVAGRDGEEIGRTTLGTEGAPAALRLVSDVEDLTTGRVTLTASTPGPRPAAPTLTVGQQRALSDQVSRSPGRIPEAGVPVTNTGLNAARSEDFSCVVSPLCLRIPAELSVIGNGRIPRRSIAVLTGARDPQGRRGVGRTCRGMGDGVGTGGFSRRRSG